VISRKSILAIFACGLIALGLAACGDDNGGGGSSDLSGNLAGAGATSQEAAEEAWIANFESDNSSVTISYDAVGSGGGREQFIAGGVDYAGSDSALADTELTDAEKQCGGADKLVQIPVYISPIAIVYNVKGVSDLQLSPDTIAGIFNQDITSWDDPAIAKDNPGTKLPSTRITPVNRSDDSGTTDNFTQYLSQAAPSVWTYPPDDTWPVKGGEAADGTSGVVEAVGAGDGTVGYADASQAGDLGIAKIKVGNEYIAPSAEGAAHDVEISKENQDIGGDKYVFAYDLERTSTDTANYPIVLVSYLITCTAGDNADIVNGFFDYVVSTDGQDAAAKNAGSAPITDKVRGQIQPAVDAIGAS
jgi:phosphate transport system substrate-binding protein